MKTENSSKSIPTSDSHLGTVSMWESPLNESSYFYIVPEVRMRGGDEAYICSLTSTHTLTHTVAVAS